MTDKMRTLMMLIMVILLIVLGGVATCKGSSSGAIDFQKLPQTDIYGQKISYTQNLYLFDIWATWCPPCRMQLPQLAEMQKDLAGKNFTVISLSTDESQETVINFIDNNGGSHYPVAMFSAEAKKMFPSVRGIPTLFLVNKKGEILKTFVGYRDKAELISAVDQYL